MSTLAVSAPRTVARPLKVLVPLIQAELDAAFSTAIEHYCAVGAMLLEAKVSGQIAHGEWQRWLTRHFTLSDRTARVYMQAARQRQNGSALPFSTTLSEAVQPGRDASHRSPWVTSVRAIRAEAHRAHEDDSRRLR